MAITKDAPEKEYAKIPNGIIKDNSISPAAFRLYCRLSTLPPDWQYSHLGMTKIMKLNKSTIARAFKQLKEAGYLTVDDARVGGKFNTDITLHARPSPPHQDGPGITESDDVPEPNDRSQKYRSEKMGTVNEDLHKTRIKDSNTKDMKPSRNQFNTFSNNNTATDYDALAKAIAVNKVS